MFIWITKIPKAPKFQYLPVVYVGSDNIWCEAWWWVYTMIGQFWVSREEKLKTVGIRCRSTRMSYWICWRGLITNMAFNEDQVSTNYLGISTVIVAQDYLREVLTLHAVRWELILCDVLPLLQVTRKCSNSCVITLGVSFR